MVQPFFHGIKPGVKSGSCQKGHPALPVENPDPGIIVAPVLDQNITDSFDKALPVIFTDQQPSDLPDGIEHHIQVLNFFNLCICTHANPILRKLSSRRYFHYQDEYVFLDILTSKKRQMTASRFTGLRICLYN